MNLQSFKKDNKIVKFSENPKFKENLENFTAILQQFF